MWLYSLETDRTDRTAPPTSTAALALARPSGPYLLRARQAQCSTEARIDLAPLPEEEQAPLAAIIAEPGRYGGYCLIPNTADAAAVSRTAALVEAYPDSRYSIYLRRTYLLRSERARRDANVDGGRAMGYETWLREHAPWSLVEEVHRSR